MRWFELSMQYEADIDVGTNRIEMIQHANFKYLVHLDGQGLSSRYAMHPAGGGRSQVY
jgi:hypothetical protein